MNEIVRFDPSHLWLCDGLVVKPKYLQSIVNNADNKNHFTIMSIFNNEDRLIGVAGVKHLHPGVAEPFAVFIKEKKKYRKMIVQSIARLLEFCRTGLSIWRLQAPTPVSQRVEIRFMEFFGFKAEGLLASYDPDTKEDCVMMGRVICQPSQ